ncbi:MAG: pyrroline-5-carboxylate reductase [Burkholderiaceae bacterium]|nr:pyrroline-5-carboxylate reductase [Burkholderiaceae bacterium]
MKDNLKISFIGGGNMASALIGGLAGKLTHGSNIHVIDINSDKLQSLQQQHGVSTAGRIDSTVEASDVIVLAVKPQQIHEVMTELAPHVSRQLILSIVAGIRAADLSRWLNGHRTIVRTMPNTPALIGQGVTGLVALDSVSQEQISQANAIMRAAGATVWLENESQIDAVTALSGSGPAYVFYFIEAMQQAAEAFGLSAQQGRELAIATFTGAAQLAAQSSEPVSVLRERVTSKGGTTFAALSSMERDDVKGAIVRAINAAQMRSKELGEEFGRG